MFETGNHYYLIYNDDKLFSKGALVKFNKTNDCVKLEEGKEVYYVLSPDVVLKGKIDARDENMDTDAAIIDGNYVKCDKVLGNEYHEYQTIGKIINFVTNRRVYFFLILLPTVCLLVYEVYLIKKNIKKD